MAIGSPSKSKRPKFQPRLKRYVDPSAEFLPVPILCHHDDLKWFKERMRTFNAGRRAIIAMQYTNIFFDALQNHAIPDFRRTGQARRAANSWLLTLR
jgi:hypothetical protein